MMPNLSPSDQQKNPLPPHDVVILGGGVAGLSAAVTLVQAGRRPLVLESARQPGGRARSFYDATFDETLDNGPHLLIGAYHATLKLLTTLGTRSHLTPSQRIDYRFWDRRHGFYSLTCPDWPAPLHLLAGVLGCTALPLKARLAALGMATAFRHDPQTLEHQTVTQWLHRQGQSGPLFERLWAPLCLSALNEPAGSANAALFARVLSRAFFDGRREAVPLLPTVPLSHLIARPAQRYLEARGGSLLCGERVKRIEHQGPRIVSIQTNRRTLSTPGGVISALPFRALRPLLPDWAEQTGFARLATAPIVSVHLLYDRPAPWPSPLLGLPFETSQWLFDRNHPPVNQDSQPPTHPPTSPPARLSGVISGAYRESHWQRETLIEAVVQDIHRLCPTLPPSTLQAARVIKERQATFAPWPGSSSLRPGHQTPWKNMMLAGDWTDTHLPATLEGAVLSGVTAGEKMLAFLAADR